MLSGHLISHLLNAVDMKDVLENCLRTVWDLAVVGAPILLAIERKVVQYKVKLEQRESVEKRKKRVKKGANAGSRVKSEKKKKKETAMA